MLPGKVYGIKDYVALVKRYWWIVVATTAVGALTALIVASTQHDLYQSNMLIQIVPQRVPARFVSPTVTSQTEDRMDSLEAQVKSRSNLERLVREFDLYPNQRRALPMEDVVEIMRQAIQIELIKPAAGRHLPADAFYVRFTYNDADTAARVTSSLGSLFIGENARERNDLAVAASEFLLTQLGEAEKKLREQEGKVERFRQQHSGRLPTQAEFNMQTITSTQADLRTVTETAARDRDRRQTLQQMLSDAMAQPAPVRPVQSATPGDASGANDVPLPQQLEAAKAQLDRLEARLTDTHPDVRRQRRLVADLEQKVAAMPRGERTSTPVATGLTEEETQRRERLNNMRAEIESLGRQIANKEADELRLRAVVADYQRRLESIPGVESEWIALNRDYDTLKSSYEDLLRKSQDSKMAAALEKQQAGEQFRIVDAASVPVRPVGAMRLRTNAAGTALGMMVGVFMVGLLFVRDTTFHSESDVLDVLSLPVLALVPHLAEPGEGARKKRRRLYVAGVVVGVVAAAAYVVWLKELWKFLT